MRWDVLAALRFSGRYGRKAGVAATTGATSTTRHAHGPCTGSERTWPEAVRRMLMMLLMMMMMT